MRIRRAIASSRSFAFRIAACTCCPAAGKTVASRRDMTRRRFMPLRHSLCKNFANYAENRCTSPATASKTIQSDREIQSSRSKRREGPTGMSTAQW